MPDLTEFTILDWRKQPLDGEVAKELRHDVRLYRRERGRSGHRFHFASLKTLWAVEGGVFAVCNHDDDAAWQFWYRDPKQGWILIDWHMTRREAQARAEQPLPNLIPKALIPKAGIYVRAGWPRPDEVTQPRISVHCQSEGTAEQIEDIFSSLGADAWRELVDA